MPEAGLPRWQAATLRLFEEDLSVEDVLEIRTFLQAEILGLKEHRGEVEQDYEERLKKLNEGYRSAINRSDTDLISAYECVVVMDRWLEPRGVSVADELTRDLLEFEGRSITKT